MKDKINSKNQKLLLDFSVYCAQHPQERFWQALRNWARVEYIKIPNSLGYELGDRDTFYFEERNK